MLDIIADGIVKGFKKTFITFFKWILLGIIDNSFWICLILCMMSLLIYAIGGKKAGKYCTGSFVLYVFLQAIKGVLL